LVRTRVFEEMKNLSARTKSDMARILTDGIGRGQNPRDIAKRLTEQTGMEIGRAKRIARTEITTALRRARWDESDEAEAQYGIMTRQMHLSALSPTTRRKHALRHGHLYTTEEVRDWYSVDGNAINCKCTQVAVLVDADGRPLNPNVIDMAKKRLEKAQQAGLVANHLHCGCGHHHAA
ncbi:phage minor head protein, partial [Pseudescherichia sp.]